MNIKSAFIVVKDKLVLSLNKFIYISEWRPDCLEDQKNIQKYLQEKTFVIFVLLLNFIETINFVSCP